MMPSLTPLLPTYEVVICTYNGADFIDEQLSSILTQKPAPKRVIVSDDGSSDGTLELVQAQIQNSSIPIDVIRGPGQGIVANALHALRHTQAEYVFLADQDDIWLENKASLFCEKMMNTAKPHLIFSDAWVWYPGRDPEITFWNADRLRPTNAYDPRQLAFHNAVQGASACVNRALIDAVRGHPDIAMHDWWLGLIAAGTGQVSIIAQPTLLYRQHDRNQLGAQSRKVDAGGPIKRYRKKRRAWLTALHQAVGFAQLYAPQLPEPQSAFFQAYAHAITSGVLHRIGFLLKWRPVRANLLRTATLWLNILGTRCRPTAPCSDPVTTR